MLPVGISRPQGKPARHREASVPFPFIKVAVLSRDFIKIGSKQIELNALGEGIYTKTGTRVIIVGEVKSNITLKETKKFINTLKAIEPTLKSEVFTLLFGFRIHLDARSLAKKEGIHLFVSYGKELHQSFFYQELRAAH